MFKYFFYTSFCLLLVHSLHAAIPLFEKSFQVNEVPYVKCNEADQIASLRELATIPIPENGAHVGWSIEFNFKVMVLRNPKLVILCDINQRVLDFHRLFEKVILSSESKEDFVHCLTSALAQEEDYFFLKSMRTLARAMRSFRNWLTEEGFQTLRQLYIEKRVHTVVLNVLDREGRFQQLAAWINEMGYTIDTVYASNISTWIIKEEPFFSNLQQLIGEQTIFIDADRHWPRHKTLAQRISLGKLPFDDVPKEFQAVCSSD